MRFKLICIYTHISIVYSCHCCCSKQRHSHTMLRHVGRVEGKDLIAAHEGGERITGARKQGDARAVTVAIVARVLPAATPRCFLFEQDSVSIKSWHVVLCPSGRFKSLWPSPSLTTAARRMPTTSNHHLHILILALGDHVLDTSEGALDTAKWTRFDGQAYLLPRS